MLRMREENNCFQNILPIAQNAATHPGTFHVAGGKIQNLSLKSARDNKENDQKAATSAYVILFYRQFFWPTTRAYGFCKIEINEEL